MYMDIGLYYDASSNGIIEAIVEFDASSNDYKDVIGFAHHCYYEDSGFRARYRKKCSEICFPFYVGF